MQVQPEASSWCKWERGSLRAPFPVCWRFTSPWLIAAHQSQQLLTQNRWRSGLCKHRIPERQTICKHTSDRFDKNRPKPDLQRNDKQLLSPSLCLSPYFLFIYLFLHIEAAFSDRSTSRPKEMLSPGTYLQKAARSPPLDCNTALPQYNSALDVLPSSTLVFRQCTPESQPFKKQLTKTSDPYPDPALQSQGRSGEKSNQRMFEQCLLILSSWHLTAHLLQNINASTKKFVRYKTTAAEDGKPKGKYEFCCMLTPKAPSTSSSSASR